MPQRKNNLLLVVATLAVAACETTAPTGTGPSRKLVPVVPAVTHPGQSEPAVQETNSPSFKQVIETFSNVPTLQQTAQRALNLRPETAATTHPGMGMFRLQLIAQPMIEKSSRPRLIGSLKQHTHAATYGISFILTSQTGSILTQGKVSVTGTPQQVIDPAPPTQNRLTENMAHQAMQKVIPQITPYIENTPWQAQVFSRVNPSHVALSIGKESGLRVGDILETTTLPRARLQVVSFENLPGDNNTRAVLRLMVGLLPQPGKFLTLTKETPLPQK